MTTSTAGAPHPVPTPPRAVGDAYQRITELERTVERLSARLAVLESVQPGARRRELDELDASILAFLAAVGTCG